MDSREPIEDHELAACAHDWRYTRTDYHGSHKGEDHYSCRTCGSWKYELDGQVTALVELPLRRPSPVAESTPTDATAVEAEREACAEVVRAAIELGLQAGRLSNALDGQEDYRLQRQAVLNAMKDLSTALDARTPKES